MKCEWPDCKRKREITLLEATFCWRHYNKVRKALSVEIERLIDAVTDDECPGTANGMCKGVRGDRDS